MPSPHGSRRSGRHRERVWGVRLRTRPRSSDRPAPDGHEPWRRRCTCRAAGEVFGPQARREEALLDQPDLVLDLPLLPARRWRTGDPIDQIVAAHLQEAAIVETAFTDEDRLYGGLHVVVDAAGAGAFE